MPHRRTTITILVSITLLILGIVVVITGSKLAGTSHLKRHIALGICPVSRLNHEKKKLAVCTKNSKSNGSQDAVNRPFRDHGRESDQVQEGIVT